ncbi:MAG TPA: winged helix-turn-helix domain-containing protein [Microbacteriaceae bacterium]|nr:winged helix-turn-helix domain-containing protein [Microbacteriaceae bacterium]
MSTSTTTQTTAEPATAQARGFALYVGIDEAKAAEAGISLPELVERLRAVVGELVPGAQTHATVAIAPAGAGGRDIDVVRAALHEPGLARQRAEAEPAPRRRTGVVIDISRKRVVLDGDTAPLTFTEFELLQFLVLREGRAVERQEIISGVWRDAPAEEIPNARTIDVHIRRLRAKLGDYEDIVRTVRGAGYRFDRHADVSIRLAATPSPDLF